MNGWGRTVNFFFYPYSSLSFDLLQRAYVPVVKYHKKTGDVGHMGKLKLYRHIH